MLVAHVSSAIINAVITGALGAVMLINNIGQKGCGRSLNAQAIAFLASSVLLLIYAISADRIWKNRHPIRSKEDKEQDVLGKYDTYNRPWGYIIITTIIALTICGLAIWGAIGTNQCNGRIPGFWSINVIVTAILGALYIFSVPFLMFKRDNIGPFPMTALRYWTSIYILFPFSFLLYLFLLPCCRCWGYSSNDHGVTALDDDHDLEKGTELTSTSSTLEQQSSLATLKPAQPTVEEQWREKEKARINQYAYE